MAAQTKRRSFSQDYKRQTVELVHSSGRSIDSIAAEIGLAETVLRKWAVGPAAKSENIRFPAALEGRPDARQTSRNRRC
jgi:transposase